MTLRGDIVLIFSGQYVHIFKIVATFSSSDNGKCGHLCYMFDIIPLTCSFFTPRKNPFVKLRSAYQPARALGGQTGSTNPPSAWHKLCRTQPYTHTSTHRVITKRHRHPGILSKNANVVYLTCLLSLHFKSIQTSPEY